MFENEKSGLLGDERRDLIRRYEDAYSKGESLFFCEEEFLDIIDFYEEVDKIDEAIEAAELAVKYYPYSSDCNQYFARMLMEAGELDLAKEKIDKALLLDNTDIENHLVLAEIYLAREEADLAEEILLDIETKIDPSDLDVYYVVFSMIKEFKEDFTSSYSYLKKSISADASNEDAWDRLWVVAEFAGEQADLISFCNAVLDKDPYNSHAWHVLGLSSFSEMEIDNAIEAFDMAINLDPDNEVSHRLLSECYIKQDKFKEALPSFEYLYKNFDQEVDVLLRYGYCLEMLEQLEKARALYRKALGIDPSNADAHFRMGMAFIYEENISRAIQSFNKAIDFAPNRMEYHIARAEANFALEKFDSAISDYEIVISSEPELLTAWVNLSRVLYAEHGIEKALGILDTAEASLGESAEVHMARALIHFLDRNLKLALIHFELGVRIDSSSAQLLFFLHPDIEKNQEVKAILARFK